MDGIVALLNEPYYTRIEDLWTELGREFGLKGVCMARFPHVSFQIAQGYAPALVRPVMREFAARHGPLSVHTAGLAVFTGPSPVLYIPVVRSPALSALHAALWDSLLPIATNPVPYYAPEAWVPHITLAYGDLTSEALPDVIRLLQGREFYWQVDLTNIALICEDGQVLDDGDVYSLTGDGESSPEPPTMESDATHERPERSQPD